MPCIWGRHDKSQVFVDVVIAEDAFADRLFAADGSNPQTPLHVYRGLIDTGAQSTCISRKVVEELQLAPIGRIPIRGVSGIRDHNFYLFRVGFEFEAPSRQPGVKQVTVHIVESPITAVELGAEDGDFDVLLGMDIIGLGSLKIDGDGSFSFSF
jgi:hypothetical protein